MQGDFGSAAFEGILSTDRFARYLAWAGGGHERALELYRLNVAASEALYTPLHVLEVALRNRIHAVLSEALGEHWFDTPGLVVLPKQHRQSETPRRASWSCGDRSAPAASSRP